MAVEKNSPDAVTILLRGGADPGKVNPILKNTAVHLAAKQGRTHQAWNLKIVESVSCLSVCQDAHLSVRQVFNIYNSKTCFS